MSEHITIITSILADRPPQDILQRIWRYLTSRRAKPRAKPGQVLPCRANISTTPNAVLDLQSPNPIKSRIWYNGTNHYTAAVSILWSESVTGRSHALLRIINIANSRSIPATASQETPKLNPSPAFAYSMLFLKQGDLWHLSTQVYANRQIRMCPLPRTYNLPVQIPEKSFHGTQPCSLPGPGRPWSRIASDHSCQIRKSLHACTKVQDCWIVRQEAFCGAQMLCTWHSTCYPKKRSWSANNSKRDCMGWPSCGKPKISVEWAKITEWSGALFCRVKTWVRRRCCGTSRSYARRGGLQATRDAS